MKSLLQFILLLLFLTGCFKKISDQQDGVVISHEIFDDLLKKYVDEKGWVNYAGFLEEQDRFQTYLKLLQENPPAENFSEHEKLAYWINAYNAFTIELILQHKPDSSIKDIGSKIQIPFVNTPWQIDFIEVNGKKIDLDDIEHGIIRKQFDEPRIHFALVCASTSCPSLRQEAYSAEKLEQQLTDQAKKFINDPTKNQIDKNNIKISKLFDWYGGDFKKKGPVIKFLNQYSEVQINAKADVEYMEYDWKLNGVVSW